MYLSDHIGANRDYFPISYWANTSSNSIVKDLVYRAGSETKAEIETLIEGGNIEKPVHEDITYGEIYEEKDNLWNFLFFTGYLKKNGFMTGILSGSNEYIVKSNRESGDGRSDLLIKTKDVFEKAFVIEIKTVKQQGENPITEEMMDACADEAIRQIDDRSYADALLEDGYGNIGRYGISFFRKRCRVHYKVGY